MLLRNMSVNARKHRLLSKSTNHFSLLKKQKPEYEEGKTDKGSILTLPSSKLRQKRDQAVSTVSMKE